MLADSLREWHDFYVLMGAASGTLVGAMFVVASISSGVLSGERGSAAREFFTPTIVHVSVILLGCAVLVVPGLTWASLGALTLGACAGGLGYSIAVWRWVRRRKLDPDDYLWYAYAPAGAYGVMVAAAVILLIGRPAGLSLLAAAFIGLLAICIRNAWDITVFVVVKNSQSR